MLKAKQKLSHVKMQSLNMSVLCCCEDSRQFCSLECTSAYCVPGRFTGNEAVLPWNNSPEVEVQHSSWTTPQFEEAADCAAVVACATNRLADVDQMPAGGYGYYGTPHPPSYRLDYIQSGINFQV